MAHPALTPRSIMPVLVEHLDALRVVVLNGARQTGKTTLMRQLDRGSFYNLDQQPMLQAALVDPVSFVRTGPEPRLIDEVQRGGDALVRAIKAAADDSRRTGQFVLAGSTNFLADPTLSESLAGRAGVLDVWPFSQGEITGAPEQFLELAFADPGAIRALPATSTSREEYFDRICVGGFPELVVMRSERARSAWFDSYLNAVVERDIRAMARIDRPGGVAAVLRGLAASTAQELVVATLADSTQLSRATVERYLSLLQTVFLAYRLPAWSRNLSARMAKHPKVHLVDTGLASHLLGVTSQTMARPVAPERGALVETFMVNEISKQASWSLVPVRRYHYRSREGAEVDLVLERADGAVVALESKAGATVELSDFRHLSALQRALGDDFVHGFVTYLGDRPLVFGDRLTAVPLDSLWTAHR